MYFPSIFRSGLHSESIVTRLDLGAGEDGEDVHDVQHLLLEGEAGAELPGCGHSGQGELIFAFFHSFLSRFCRSLFTAIARPLSYVTCF